MGRGGQQMPVTRVDLSGSRAALTAAVLSVRRPGTMADSNVKRLGSVVARSSVTGTVSIATG